MRKLLMVAASVAALAAAAPANASVHICAGALNDPSNTLLMAPDLGPPQFGDDFAIANNTALCPIHSGRAGVFSFTSLGFSMGGADPYFTVFSGRGPAAEVVASNHAQAFSTGGDFHIDIVLPAGDYTLAIGAFANMSFAENLGLGSLGDGFVGLGTPDALRNSLYWVTVALPDSPFRTPEPATLALLAAGVAGVLRRRR